MTRNDMYLTGKTIKGRIRVLTNAKAAALALYEATKPAEIGPDATEAEEVAYCEAVEAGLEKAGYYHAHDALFAAEGQLIDWAEATMKVVCAERFGKIEQAFVGGRRNMQYRSRLIEICKTFDPRS